MYTFRILTCTIREIIKARDDVCESKSFSYITISIEVATLTVSVLNDEFLFNMFFLASLMLGLFSPMNRTYDYYLKRDTNPIATQQNS